MGNRRRLFRISEKLTPHSIIAFGCLKEGEVSAYLNCRFESDRTVSCL